MPSSHDRRRWGFARPGSASDASRWSLLTPPLFLSLAYSFIALCFPLSLHRGMSIVKSWFEPESERGWWFKMDVTYKNVLCSFRTIPYDLPLLIVPSNSSLNSTSWVIPSKCLGMPFGLSDGNEKSVQIIHSINDILRMNSRLHSLTSLICMLFLVLEDSVMIRLFTSPVHIARYIGLEPLEHPLMVMIKDGDRKRPEM